MIRLSLFNSAKDGIAKVSEMTWEALAAGLGPHSFQHTQKDHLPAFSPAEYMPGAPRLAKNVIRVWFGVLDLDKVSSQALERVVSHLAGLDAIVYTTWSHPLHHQTRGVWCVRVIVRLSRPIEAVEWASFWPSLVARFEAPADPQCKDPNRIYYGPFAPPGTGLEQCCYVVLSGQPLDVSQLAVQAFGAVAQQGTEKITRERLTALAKAWKRSKTEGRQHLGGCLERLVKGEEFADLGSVDVTIFQLCQDLIKTWPNADPASLAAHFAQSIQLMGPNPHTVEQVQAKLERAQQVISSEAAAVEYAAVTETKLRIREAFKGTDTPDRDWPYTTDELDRMSYQTKAGPDEFQKRWIIQRGPAFYVLCPGGLYSRPYTEKDVMSGVLRDLAPARSAGVDLWTVNQQGDPVRKSLAALMADYGSVAQDHVLDLRIQESSYDAPQRLYVEASCPKRPLVPTFDAEVQHWLGLLAGEFQIKDVLNWIALVTDLDSTCAALMITGPGDSGKGLLAYGLSRIWTTNQPTSLEQALNSFNAALARCPLVFADEQLPKDFRGFGRTAELREFLGAMSRPYRVKHLSDASIIGAIRLIVAANNEDVLAIQGDMSRNDIGAIADRFVHIRIPEYQAPTGPRSWAGDYLNTINAPSFVRQDRLARHALWLRDNYPVRREGRFLIRTAGQADTIRALSTKGGIRSAVCQWLVGYLKGPARVDARGDYMIRVSGGKLLVNAQGVLDCWDFYVKEPIPSAGRLAGAIGNLSTERTHRGNPRGGSTRYRIIDTAHLVAWAEQTEFSTKEEIDQALAVDTEKRTPGSGALAFRPPTLLN